MNPDMVATVTMELGRRLRATGLVAPEEIEAALFVSMVRGIPFVRALLDRGSIGERALDEELGREGDMALRQVTGDPALMALLPPALCRRLGAIPTRRDETGGVVEVAAADPLDPHLAHEMAHHLRAPVRVRRASMSAIEEALRKLELADEATSAPARYRRMTPAFPHGAPDTIPPLPIEDVPIPLVRRAGAPLVGSLVDARDADEDEPVLTPGRPREESGASGEGRPPVLRRAASELPSVSFPSSPPPASLEEGLAPSRPRHRPSLSFELRPRQAPARGTPVPARVVESRENRPPSSASGETSSLLRALEGSATRDEVVRTSLRLLRQLGRRVAVFAIKRDGYHGWACNLAFGDAQALREVAVPAELPSVFATACATSVYLGPIPASPAHRSLLRIMGHASGDVGAVAVRVASRPVMVLLADDLADTMSGTRAMIETARVAGLALTRLLAVRPSRTSST